ncbi:MAG: NifU family protein [Actinobacteria bacterium]|nr:NifU family protein [Actinomycetota bacterium]
MGQTLEAGLEERVRQALELIRPAIQMDGGDVLLESVRDGKVTVRLLGTCDGCPMSPVTLRQGVERILREHVPEVTEVSALF